MSIQFSVPVRNAKLDAIETAIGTSPILRIYDLSGSAPANCAASISGTIIATLALPASWLEDAASGTKAISGTWQDMSADNAGTPEFFRIFDSGDSTCHIQGTVTFTGGGGDMIVDSASVNQGQQFSVSTFTLTEGNA